MSSTYHTYRAVDGRRDGSFVTDDVDVAIAFCQQGADQLNGVEADWQAGIAEQLEDGTMLFHSIVGPELAFSS